MTILPNRFDLAMLYASEVHNGHKRKPETGFLTNPFWFIFHLIDLVIIEFLIGLSAAMLFVQQEFFRFII